MIGLDTQDLCIAASCPDGIATFASEQCSLQRTFTGSTRGSSAMRPSQVNLVRPPV